MAPVTELEQRDVVVVGGGVAGLTAAYELPSRDVLVLEADEAIGGRSRRGSLNGGRITVGGEGWYDANPDSYERDLLSQLDIPLADAAPGRSGLIRPGAVAASSSWTEVVDAFPLSRAAKDGFVNTYRRASEAAERLVDPQESWAVAKELASIRASDWLGDLHPEALDVFRQLLAGEFSVVSEETTALQLIWGLPPGAKSNWSVFQVPEGGGASIAERLHQKLANPPRTGAVVRAVEYDRNGCTVTYDHEGERKAIRARHAIVATTAAPLTRLVRGLPSWKTQALTWIRSDPVISLYLAIETGGETPWNDLSAAWAVDMAFGMLLRSETDIQNRKQGDSPADRSIIHLFAAGRVARSSLDLPEHVVADSIERDFIRAFPTAEGRIKERFMRRWYEGSTALRFGYAEHVPAILAPVGGVHFAGAYSGYVHNDTVGGFGREGKPGEFLVTGGLHAAMRSAVRVAREIQAESGLEPAAA